MEYTYIELKNEKWRDIDGYDGMYQVSDLGRVRSNKSGEWKVLSGSKDSWGYCIIGLSLNCKRKNYKVHRLVASAFIENDDDTKNEINHINEIKTDNRASNLEWCNRQYNATYNRLQYRRQHTEHKIDKLKDLYNPDLSINENLELFRANGIECSRNTVKRLRRDLNLKQQKPYIHPRTKRDEIKDIYDQNLSIEQNMEIFNENGIEFSYSTIKRLRRDLGLINQK